MAGNRKEILDGLQVHPFRRAVRLCHPQDLGAADFSRLQFGEGPVGLRKRKLFHIGTEWDLRGEFFNRKITRHPETGSERPLLRAFSHGSDL
jgi:hypothetical protein